MNRGILIGLLGLGVALALYLLPWYAGIGLIAGLLVLGVMAGPAALRGPSFAVRAAVLEGASVEVLASRAMDIAGAWEGAPDAVRKKGELAVPDDLNRYYVVDVIVTPGDGPPTKINWWTPSDIHVAPQNVEITPDGPVKVLHRMVWQGENFAPDDGDKYVGPLRLHLSVASSVSDGTFELHYCGRRLGAFRLAPLPKPKKPPAALNARAGFHMPPPEALIPPSDPRATGRGANHPAAPSPPTASSGRDAQTMSFGSETSGMQEVPEGLAGLPIEDDAATERIPSGVRARMHSSMTSPTYRFPSEVILDVYSTIREKFRIPPVQGLDADAFRPIGRHERPEWFGRNVLPPNGIPDPEPEVLDRLLHATYVYRIRVQVPETRDLSYLAHALTTASSLARAIDGVIRDVQTQLVITSQEARGILKSSDFDISKHVLVHALKDPGGGEALWLHTHGMGKFGRPDLEMRDVPEEHADVARHGLLTIADYLSQGAVVRPGETMQLGDAYLTFTLAPGEMGDEEFPNGLIRVTDFDPELSAPAVGVMRWISAALA